MVSVYGYNPEKKQKSFSDIYLMAIFFGIFSGFIVIGGGIGIKYFLFLIINKWKLSIGIVVILFLIKMYVLPKLKKEKRQQHINHGYN